MRATSASAPRIARARSVRNAALGRAALAARSLAAAWFVGEYGLGWLERRANRARARLAAELHGTHGVDFYAPLDERVPADLLSGLPLIGSSAVRVPGAFGSARRFDGKGGENLAAPWKRWSAFAPTGFTLAFRARLPETPAGEQRLVWDRDGNAGFGLRFLDGRLEASFRDAEGFHVLSAPAPEPGRFVPVAFSLGPDRAALFLGGTERDACAVSPPLALKAHGVSFGTDLHFPPSLDVDEWIVFRRPLDAGEISRLAAARKPLPALLEPRAAASLRRREAQAAAFRSLLATVGAIRPTGPTPAVLNRAFPVLELRLSKADRRHFRAAHLEALASGFRTKRGARARRVQASFGGTTERIAAWLDERVPASGLSTRPAFVLASEGGLFGEGSGLARLFPPEQFAERFPDAARPLPLEPSSLVRLHLDGDFLGLYCLLPFEAPAPPWFATGARDPSRSARLHFATPSALPGCGAGMDEKERNAAYRRMTSLLGTDPGFPLRPPEARLLARRHAAMREAMRLPDPVPGEAPLLGSNPAALYVTEDLDLAAAGEGVAWRSSDPETIAPDGRVARPENGPPRIVFLTATFPGGTERTYRFRVMPQAPALGALFLSFGRPLDKLARTEFACLHVPAGKDARGEWLYGTGAGGGGAKLRGNTSYVTGLRRSINLKFDGPVLLSAAERPVRHLLLLSGYADPTRLRNALSFEACRAMAPDGPVRATGVAWAEVFVNGAYAGVWECCPRLQDAVDEDFSALYKVRAPGGLWTSAGDSAEVVDRADRGGKGAAEGDPYAPFRDLARFVAESDGAAFAAGAADAFDLDELADFFLLVNFTGNEDGRVTNQYAGKRRDDGRWLLLPWDYDKTFLSAPAGALARSRLLVSPLFARLLGEVPGYRERVAERWRALRAGPLREERLDAWIDEKAALLAPCMDEDYRLIPPLGHEGTFADAIESLRREVRFRLSHMDRFCSDPTLPW